jgi:glycosyltransferase involved in cell wall biosynthesis
MPAQAGIQKAAQKQLVLDLRFRGGDGKEGFRDTLLYEFREPQSMNPFRACALLPTYDNPCTLAQVVEQVRVYLPDVLVVDDGSAQPGREAAEALGHGRLARVHRRERNGGKGAAVKDGFRLAQELGFTHALQIDADGQHDPAAIPDLLQASRERPEALVLAYPVFDDSAPGLRRRGRLISRFWTDIETGGRFIRDPLCGLRVYPIESAIRAGARGDRMDFDTEIAVRMVWLGCPIVNLPVHVRYLTPEQGGVSHFRMVHDNLLIGWAHTRLCTSALIRWLAGDRSRVQ